VREAPGNRLVRAAIATTAASLLLASVALAAADSPRAALAMGAAQGLGVLSLALYAVAVAPRAGRPEAEGGPAADAPAAERGDGARG